MAEGRMHPPGLAQVKAAQSDGRWERAYAGSAEMEIPEDFLLALAKNARAKKCLRRSITGTFLHHLPAFDHGEAPGDAAEAHRSDDRAAGRWRTLPCPRRCLAFPFWT